MLQNIPIIIGRSAEKQGKIQCITMYSNINIGRHQKSSAKLKNEIGMHANIENRAENKNIANDCQFKNK